MLINSFQFIRISNNKVINIKNVISVQHLYNGITILYFNYIDGKSFNGSTYHSNYVTSVEEYTIKKLDDPEQYTKLFNFFFVDCVL